MNSAPLLRVKALTHYFGELAAVKNVSVRVNEGENCSIIGPNGAGKTTLFDLITGEFPPASGQIWFKDQNITQLPPDAIARGGVARSFQLNTLFPDFSVYENLRLAVQARAAKRDSMFQLARQLPGVDERVHQVLEQIGLKTHAQQSASELSHGDQRHLEIGLALASSPHLLMLDEPTSGMSPLETQKTIELILDISKSITLLLIEHDMDVVMSVSDRIVVMHHGEVLAEGTPASIEQNEQVQEAYFGAL